MWNLSALVEFSFSNFTRAYLYSRVITKLKPTSWFPHISPLIPSPCFNMCFVILKVPLDQFLHRCSLPSGVWPLLEGSLMSLGILEYVSQSKVGCPVSDTDFLTTCETLNEIHCAYFRRVPPEGVYKHFLLKPLKSLLSKPFFLLSTKYLWVIENHLET